MNLYNLHVRPTFAYAYRFAQPQLEAASVERMLLGSRVRASTPADYGYVVAIEFERGDHSDALDELSAAFSQLGFTIVRAGIAELATSWLGGATIGASSGAAVGAMLESAEAFVGLLIGGAIVGALVGAEKRSGKAHFTAELLPGYGWRLTPTPAPRATLRPQLA